MRTLDREPEVLAPAYSPAPVLSLGITLCAAIVVLVGALYACVAALRHGDLLERQRFIHRQTGRWVQRFWAINSGWKIRFEGLEHVDDARQFILVANHQSVVDPFLLYWLPIDFKWIIKRWVFSVPCIGLVLRLTGHVKAAPGATLPLCRMALCEGWSLAFFPEGTRSEDGSMRHFKLGAFRMATEFGIPILPIVITGTRDILPKHKKLLGKKAAVRVKLLEPITPQSAGNDPHLLRSATEEMMRAVI